MSTIINATTTNGVVIQPDNSGSLVLQTNSGTTALTIDTSQNVTLAGTLAMSSSFMRNRIINGDMTIDQRNAGASVSTSSGASVYSVDRWNVLYSQTSKFTVQQNAGSVTPPTGFSNYMGFTSSSAYSLTSTDYFQFQQSIEGFNTADLDFGKATAKTITISFWARSSLTGNFGIWITNSAGNRIYPTSYTISSANTWTYCSVTIAGDTSGTWIGATNGTGIRVVFNLGYGSTYVGGGNAWNATYYQPSGCTNLVATNGATLYITGIQLEIGSTATPFERRLYNQELANCQRYCLKLGGDSAYVPYGTGNNYSTTNGTMVVNFPVSMRTVPTLTVTAPNRVLSGSVANSVSAMSLGNGGTLAAYVDYTSTGLTIGQGSYLTSNGSTAGNLLFSAEL